MGQREEDLKLKIPDEFILSEGITPRQIRLILNKYSLRDRVEEYFTKQKNRDAQDEWLFSTRIYVSSPLVQELAGVLKLEESQLKTMFLEAAKL